VKTPGTHIVALVTHARDVPAGERTAFARRLAEGLDDAALVLETCHRVEGYLDVRDDLDAIRQLLPRGGRMLIGTDAVRHAVAVAAGRDSVVIGEDQILHQIRLLLARTRRVRSLDPILERLFAAALHAGRRARSWRRGPVRSLADVALGGIAAQQGLLAGQPILVVGAGQMGRLAAHAAATAGARVSIANRSADRAAVIAAEVGGVAEAMDPGRRLRSYAGIIVAIGGAWPIAGEALEALSAGSGTVVDLSVPPALDDAVIAALGARFVSADALIALEPAAARDDHAIARLDALIDATAAEFDAWLDGHEGRAVAAALTARADRERLAELDELWRRLPDLAPGARQEIEQMSWHLARRLLHEPLARLGRDADGRAERAARDLFAL
jgi:glutamyl-tRNA reductase